MISGSSVSDHNLFVDVDGMQYLSKEHTTFRSCSQLNNRTTTITISIPTANFMPGQNNLKNTQNNENKIT